ncbi:HlyD family type I secretion periplasmic adaptor subunit [Azospirillum picis]|uniref:Membrane fusion protein (MFP) family protein n=1 Tax=Azospirillum picis TaxID=488438 RepID=A0ABU0MI80_9PROT|nr:HlyD family type I secretion periplasmic adaptor subunit [Azospirillum picis]MBP2298822.1 HlyD family secretion protein/adhesin transport system membrane fusion protein [Azospirillum picis]MDQ0532936.1 HlyD family secretion protein/adhesin transport system membrane fusion protein [Azospirillum picis]
MAASDLARPTGKSLNADDAMLSLVRATILVLVLLLAALLAWATLMPVKEAVVTAGQVAPSGNAQVVQHLEGGIVSEILVKDSDLVEAGQPLVVFDAKQVKAELEQMNARLLTLDLRAERLRAFAAGRAPDFARFAGADPTQVADQRLIFETQRQARDTATAVLRAQVSQREAELALYEGQLASIKDQIALITGSVDIRTKLESMGLSSKLQSLETQREQSRLLGEQRRIEGQIIATRQAITEAGNRILDQTAKLAQDAITEMGTVTAEIAQLREAKAKLDDRAQRLTVLSPVRGLVQDLRVNTVGAVVPEGGVLMQVVPVDHAMTVEAHVTPRDVGQLHIGLGATVKVLTYDFARYGAIPGKLQRISASTFLDEQHRPYYKAIIELERNHVGQDDTQHPVLPGMTTQVEMTTGERSLLDYLLKPIYFALSDSFTER